MGTTAYLQARMVAILVSALVLATEVPNALRSDEDLRRDWVEIQTNRDRKARKTWWQDVNLERLGAFLAAGAEISITDSRGWTPLHSAARHNSDPEVLSALLRAGAIVDARDRSGDTALHWAAADNSNVEMINRLLDAGADVNAVDKFGWLPIHAAADRNSNPEVIEALLTAGAQRNRRAYYFFFRPIFLLKHNSRMSDEDKKIAIGLLKRTD